VREQQVVGRFDERHIASHRVVCAHRSSIRGSRWCKWRAAEYEERVFLRDGTTVLIRSIRLEDKHELGSGFERLSPLSRYRRFLGPKSRLRP